MRKTFISLALALLVAPVVMTASGHQDPHTFYPTGGIQISQAGITDPILVQDIGTFQGNCGIPAVVDVSTTRYITVTCAADPPPTGFAHNGCRWHNIHSMAGTPGGVPVGQFDTTGSCDTVSVTASHPIPGSGMQLSTTYDDLVNPYKCQVKITNFPASNPWPFTAMCGVNH